MSRPLRSGRINVVQRSRALHNLYIARRNVIGRLNIRHVTGVNLLAGGASGVITGRLVLKLALLNDTRYASALLSGRRTVLGRVVRYVARHSAACPVLIARLQLKQRLFT